MKTVTRLTSSSKTPKITSDFISAPSPNNHRCRPHSHATSTSLRNRTSTCLGTETRATTVTRTGASDNHESPSRRGDEDSSLATVFHSLRGTDHSSRASVSNASMSVAIASRSFMHAILSLFCIESGTRCLSVTPSIFIRLRTHVRSSHTRSKRSPRKGT